MSTTRWPRRPKFPPVAMSATQPQYQTAQKPLGAGRARFGLNSSISRNSNFKTRKCEHYRFTKCLVSFSIWAGQGGARVKIFDLSGDAYGWDNFSFPPASWIRRCPVVVDAGQMGANRFDNLRRHVRPRVPNHRVSFNWTPNWCHKNY